LNQPATEISSRRNGSRAWRIRITVASGPVVVFIQASEALVFQQDPILGHYGITFTVKAGDNKIVHKGTVSGEEMKLKVEFGERTLEMTARRAGS
jgi:hypothetical protein